MIERLKRLIDNSEDHPEIKDILLKVAKMPEHKQEDTLKMVETVIAMRIGEKPIHFGLDKDVQHE